MKKMLNRFRLPFLCALCLLVFTSSSLLAAGKPGSPKRVSAERFVTIDFNSVDINVFIKFISELTGRNFVVDNRVKGKVTIISPKKISIKEAYRVFESVLEVHGFTTLEAGEITKVIPAPDARSKNIQTRLKQESRYFKNTRKRIYQFH